MGQALKGQIVVRDAEGGLRFEATGKPVEPDDYPRKLFTPSVGQVFASLALIGVGLGITAGLSVIGRDPEPDHDEAATR